MPIYTYINKKTKKIVRTPKLGIQTIAEMEQYLLDNPHLDVGVPEVPPTMVDAFKLGRVKPSEKFRDVLREMKKRHKGNTINVM